VAGDRLGEARFLLLAVAGAGVLTYAVKTLLRGVGPDADTGGLADFPSGHASAVVALAGAVVVLAFALVHGPRARLSVVAGGVVVTILVGWSRVVAGVHTPLDVFGGIVLAFGWLAICCLLWGPGRTGPSPARAALVAALCLCTSAAVLLAAGRDAVLEDDVRALARVREHTTPTVERGAHVLDVLGRGLVLLLVVLAAVAVLVARRRVGDGLFVAAATLGSAGLVRGLQLATESQGLALGTVVTTHFPSGHATVAVATYGALAAVVGSAARRARDRTLVVTAGLVLGLAVGASGVVLGWRLPSDVTAGCLVGGAWLCACALARGLAWDR
jgi:membrane-associated phospholipid phosphatase